MVGVVVGVVVVVVVVIVVVVLMVVAGPSVGAVADVDTFVVAGAGEGVSVVALVVCTGSGAVYRSNVTL